MFPVEFPVLDFEIVMEYVITGIGWGLVIFFVVFFLSWALGFLITFFKSIGLK